MSISGNPITALLAQEKLIGENFIKWKSNMNLLLVSENYKFVLNEECPDQPSANAPKHVRDKYDVWIQSNNKAKCYMLVSMSDVLRTKHESMETTFQILESLNEMFGHPSYQSRHEATKTYMNTKMKKGKSVREHVLNMISVLHKAETHGVIMDEKTEVSIILESLTHIFSAFTINYVIKKLDFNMTISQ